MCEIQWPFENKNYFPYEVALINIGKFITDRCGFESYVCLRQNRKYLRQRFVYAFYDGNFRYSCNQSKKGKV